ncbi:hypothetical protein ACFSS8_03090 [Paracoccus kondratievae]
MAELSAVPDTRREALQGHAAMLLFSAAIAGSFSLGARAANLIDPAAISAARFAIAAGVIGGIVMAGPGIQRAAFRAPWRYLVLGGLFAAYFVLMFEGSRPRPHLGRRGLYADAADGCGFWLAIGAPTPDGTHCDSAGVGGGWVALGDFSRRSSGADAA